MQEEVNKDREGDQTVSPSECSFIDVYNNERVTFGASTSALSHLIVLEESPNVEHPPKGKETRLHNSKEKHQSTQCLIGHSTAQTK